MRQLAVGLTGMEHISRARLADLVDVLLPEVLQGSSNTREQHKRVMGIAGRDEAVV
jgi:hypothetical protein